jgi:hypothetical protein
MLMTRNQDQEKYQRKDQPPAGKGETDQGEPTQHCRADEKNQPQRPNPLVEAIQLRRPAAPLGQSFGILMMRIVGQWMFPFPPFRF